MAYVAIYSAKAAEEWPTIFWQRADGSEVEVTAVARSEDLPWRDWYMWDDAEDLGEVVEYARPGRNQHKNLKMPRYEDPSPFRIYWKRL